MSIDICIFGDSIAWGAWDPEKGGWVTRLRSYYETNENEVYIYNQGIPGDNTKHLLERFDVECRAREPQIIIIAIGINDSQYVGTKDNPRVAPDRFGRNLKELIDKAKRFSDKIAFIGITNVDEHKATPTPWSKEKFYDNESISKYNSIIEKVCTKHKLPFLDLFNLLEKDDLCDGLHPNAKGHNKIFLKVKDFLFETEYINDD